MNKHRLYRKSKKMYGKGFFSDLISAVGKEVKSTAQDKTKDIVKEKLDNILLKLKNRKHYGSGLKKYHK